MKSLCYLISLVLLGMSMWSNFGLHEHGPFATAMQIIFVISSLVFVAAGKEISHIK